jgi:hypothetical protein
MNRDDPGRLREAADRAEMTDVLARFHHAVDGKDWDALVALLAPDVVAHYPDAPESASAGPGDPLRGREEVARWLAAILGTTETFHSMTNHAFELHDDTARSTSYVASFFAGSYATFECEWRWTDEGWLMAEYTLVHLQVPGAPAPPPVRKGGGRDRTLVR